MMLSILTPTRNRPEAFALLSNQVDDFEEWIIVNDGRDLLDTAHISNSRQIIRHPIPGEGHSLCENLLVGLAAAENDLIAVAEDDDHYGDGYFTALQAEFAADPNLVLCGYAPAHYYHVPSRSFQCMGNGRGAQQHCSLGMSMWRRSLNQTIIDLCKRGRPCIDIPLWHTLGFKRKIIPTKQTDGRLIHVGLKGLPGERGIGIGHQPLKERDPSLDWLRVHLGPDANRYAALCEQPPSTR